MALPYSMRMDIRRFHILSKAFGGVAASLLTAAVGWAEMSGDLPPSPPILSACEVDYPPFCIVEPGGRVDGFAVELLRASVEAMGRTVVFETGAWPEVRQLLEQGSVEVLPLVGRTPEREALFDFTVPYLTMHGAIVVRRDDSRIRLYTDLHGKRVAVMQGDNAEEFLRRDPHGFDLLLLPTFTDALRAVSEGRADAVVIQRLVALRLLQETGLRDLTLLDQPVPGFRQEFCFAVKEGDRETLALLNEGLSIAVANGTHRRLHSKWFASLELPSTRRIIIGGDHDYPPFEYLDALGRPKGFTVDLARAIAHEMDLDIEIRLGSWSEVFESLKHGQIDAIEGMFYSTSRSEHVDFTPSYYTLHHVAIVRKDSGPPPSTWEELRGLRLVVQQGDIIHELLVEKGFGEQTLVVDTPEEALQAVSDGLRDCTIAINVGSMFLIQRHGWSNLVAGRDSFLAGNYCFGVARGNAALLAHLSEGLKRVSDSGEYQRIRDKWLGVYEDDRLSRRDVFHYAGWILAPLLLVLAFALLWSWSLRRQVARRTAELAQSETRYRSLFRNRHSVMLVVDPETGAIVDANPAASTYYGWSEDELRGMNIAQVNTLSSEEIKAEMAKTQAEGRNSFLCRHRRVDGEIRDVEVFSGPIQIGGRTLLYSIVHDVTLKKRADANVARLNRILRAVRDINELIVREDDPRRLVAGACQKLVDFRSYAGAMILLVDPLKGRATCHAHAGMDVDYSPLSTWLEDGRLPPGCPEASAPPRPPAPAPGHKAAPEIVRLDHGGTTFGFLVVCGDGLASIDSEERKLLGEMADDIAYALNTLHVRSARDAAQHSLAQSQRMESIGRLAGGVAHDFNNLLMGIMGYAELFQEDLPQGHPGQELLDQIIACAKRAANLTRQLLAFAQRQPIQPKSLDLNAAVDQKKEVLQRLLGENVQFSWKPARDLGWVQMDESQLDQILTTLCANAREAIDGRGKVSIRTRNATVENDGLRTPAIPAGQYVLLEVFDDGKAIDPEALDAVFEPFFSARKGERGHGLGLSTVHGIMKQNHGYATVHSEPGNGTTFALYFPRRAEEPAAIPADAPPTSSRTVGGTETLLVVEDEEVVLSTARRMLQDAGYNVLACVSPKTALQLAKDHPSTIDLLLTDVIMPDLNGRELADAVLEVRPSIRVLYMSGYTADVIARRGILEKDVAFLPKPFDRRALLRKVRAVLDSERLR